MKKILSFFILLNSFLAFSQDNSLEFSIEELKSKIQQSAQGEKLLLMNSLAGLTRGKMKKEFDSIAKETMNYAFHIDSIQFGINFTSNCIYYYSDALNNSVRAIEIYTTFKKRNIDTSLLDTSSTKAYARLQIATGDAHYFSGKIKEAIPFYENAERFALKVNDTAKYAQALSYKASAYADTGNYVLASKSLKDVTEIARKTKDTLRLSNAQSGLADLYSRIDFLEEAKAVRNENIERSLQVHKYDIKSSHRILISDYTNASIDAEKQGNDSLRIALLEEALKHLNEPNVEVVYRPLVVYGLTRAYSETGNINKAKQYFDEMNTTYSNQNRIPFPLSRKEAIVAYHMAIKDFKTARIEAEEALKMFEAAQQIQGTFQTKQRLALIYKELGDFKTAYTYHNAATILKDSTQSIKKARALSYYQTLYETEKRDFKIADQASEISLLDAENKINQQWMLFGGIGLLALFSIIYLIRSKRFAQKRQEMQEDFSQNLINEQEKERARLARDLHDSVGQKLMLLSKQTKKTGNENMEHLASSTLEEIRSISRGLHPSNLERLGLTEAINALVYDINVNTDLFFTEEIDRIDNILSKESELHLYRIIQETLSNIVKHSEAKAVKMNLKKMENTIEVEVSDNGKGFDLLSKQKSMSLGLKTLFERAKIIGAQMKLNSEIHKGTVLSVNIPI